MAHAYTPGLKVLHYSNVKKDRRLPIKGQVNKKKGDLVNANDVVAKTDLPGNVSMVKVANLLNIAPSDINDIKDVISSFEPRVEILGVSSSTSGNTLNVVGS